MKWILAFAAVALTSTAAVAEPIGRWWAGYGQGTMEYAIKNDSAGADYFYIACPYDGATINITVGAKDAPPFQAVIVVIGADEYELTTDKNGDFRTDSHFAYDTFRSLWASIRAGAAMRVRLSTGQSTVFSLKGAAKTLPREQCKTSFEI